MKVRGCLLRFGLVAIFMTQVEALRCTTYPRTEDGYSIDVGPAMKGYNPFLANGFAEDGNDPGLKTGVIFDPSCGGDPKTHYADFLNVYIKVNCEQSFSSLTAESLSEYAEQSHQSVSFQDDASFDVSASGWGFSVHASAKYAVNRDRSSNQASEVMQSGKGEVITAGAFCITHDIDIADFSRKKFDRNFIQGLYVLNETLNSSQEPEERLSAYSRFTRAFGTHFIRQTDMGASMTYQKVFSERSKSAKRQQERASCFTESAGGCVGGGGGALGFSADANACINREESKCGGGSGSSSSSNGDTYSSVLVISRGSRPKETLKEWLNSKFQPYPVRMQLAPITELINSYNLEVSEEYGINKALNADGIRELLDWGNSQYCTKVLKLNQTMCREQFKGCGLSGNCPAGQVCFDDPSQDRGFTCASADVDDRKSWTLSASPQLTYHKTDLAVDGFVGYRDETYYEANPNNGMTYFQIELPAPAAVKAVILDFSSEWPSAQYDKEIRVGDVGVDADTHLERPRIFTHNKRCNKIESSDRLHLEVKCEGGPIMGRFVTVQCTDPYRDKGWVLAISEINLEFA